MIKQRKTVQNKRSARSLEFYLYEKVLERGSGKTFSSKRVSPGNIFNYSSSTLTGTPSSMDLLHAMVKETDLNASA